MDNELGNNKPNMVEITLRFKVGLQKAGPVDSCFASLLEAGAAELLEWYFDYPIVSHLHKTLEPNTYVDPEGGCGYTVQS